MATISDAETIVDEVSTSQLIGLMALAYETSTAIIKPLYTSDFAQQIVPYIDKNRNAYGSIRRGRAGAINAICAITGSRNLRAIHKDLTDRVTSTKCMVSIIRYAFVSVYIASEVCKDSSIPHPTSLKKALRLYNAMRRALWYHATLGGGSFELRNKGSNQRGIKRFRRAYWLNILEIMHLVEVTLSRIGRKKYVFKGVR